jgi:hypothetical protein
MRGKTATYKCLGCKCAFIARVADRNRGWARYCSKSCKATVQTATTGQSSPKTYYCSQCGERARKYIGADQIEYLCDHHAAEWCHPMSSEGLGQW